MWVSEETFKVQPLSTPTARRHLRQLLLLAPGPPLAAPGLSRVCFPARWGDGRGMLRSLGDSGGGWVEGGSKEGIVLLLFLSPPGPWKQVSWAGPQQKGNYPHCLTPGAPLSEASSG